MTKWLPKRENAETREIRDALTPEQFTALGDRFRAEVPHVNVSFLDEHCPSLSNKAERYNLERNRACCAEDIDKLAHVRQEMEQQMVEALCEA